MVVGYELEIVIVEDVEVEEGGLKATKAIVVAVDHLLELPNNLVLLHLEPMVKDPSSQLWS